METMTKKTTLPHGTEVEITITLNVSNHDLKDNKEIWGFFRECADTFHICRIPRVIGENSGDDKDTGARVNRQTSS